ncbi:ABC-2 type transport system permease protein [Microbacterium sp. cf046]|uniref:transporter n=1 Tax=Microbacterium sp. cf046 TaxID=1761803 RepID=UPI0008E4934F|nr:transporter [Microbacterium sp. cf046]SFR92586.1 ABC-2 type transport system permease protein [Microbacterium sp. cf046]
MVVVLLRLRFRVLANTLGRNTFQLVAVILGGVFSVFLVAAGLGVMLLASTTPAPATQAIVVVGGSALVLAWLIVPLLFDGVDRTLDPLKLARFPVRTRTLMTAVFLVGILWFPGIATFAVSMGTALAWRLFPAAAAVAIITGLLGAATCIIAAQLMTEVAGTLLRGRGAVRVAIVVVALLLVITPLAVAVVGRTAAGGAETLASLTSAVGVLGWTPLGAVWSVPGRVAAGDVSGAAGAAAIALGTLAVLVVTWRAVLATALRVRGERPARTVAGGRLGLLAWAPSTPAGAIAARSLIYWFRDSRQARQLILLPVLPALMLLWWSLFHFEWMAIAIGPVVAALLPLSAFATLSYDGTAFGAELAAGVRGVHDRLGRAVALVVIAGPATIVVQVVVAAIIGRMPDLPALLGLSLGILLISVGVVSVSSARVVVPVERSGRNAFSAQAGAATASIFASYAVAAVTIVLALPVIALMTAALVTGAPLLAWMALAAGLITGVGVALGGIVLGGRLLDAEGPAMLARLRVIRV